MEKHPIIALPDAIQAEADRLGFPLGPDIAQRLARFVELLARWNARIRLVGKADAPTLVGLHLADALALADAISRQEHLARSAAFPLIDVGTGAGLPGFAVALLLPEARIALCEVSEKRVSFLYEAERLLHAGVEILHRPVEQLLAEGRTFPQVVSRATFPPPEWLAIGRALCAPGGLIWSLWTAEQEREYVGPAPLLRVPYALVDGRQRVIVAWQQPK